MLRHREGEILSESKGPEKLVRWSEIFWFQLLSRHRECPARSIRAWGRVFTPLWEQTLVTSVFFALSDKYAHKRAITCTIKIHKSQTMAIVGTAVERLNSVWMNSAYKLLLVPAGHDRIFDFCSTVFQYPLTTMVSMLSCSQPKGCVLGITTPYSISMYCIPPTRFTIK